MQSKSCTDDRDGNQIVRAKQITTANIEMLFRRSTKHLDRQCDGRLGKTPLSGKWNPPWELDPFRLSSNADQDLKRAQSDIAFQ